jgi:hypothetical protein
MLVKARGRGRHLADDFAWLVVRAPRLGGGIAAMNAEAARTGSSGALADPFNRVEPGGRTFESKPARHERPPGSRLDGSQRAGALRSATIPVPLPLGRSPHNVTPKRAARSAAPCYPPAAMRTALLFLVLSACSDDFWGTDKDPDARDGDTGAESDADTDADADADSDSDTDTDADTDTGTPPDPADVDDDGDGVTENEGDCDDTRGDVSPVVDEVPYNGVDDDCDPTTRDDDVDGDGFGRAEDCDDTDASANPDASETLDDGADNDCDGEADEPFEVETVDAGGDIGNPSAIGVDSTGTVHLVARDGAVGTLQYFSDAGRGWSTRTEIVSETEVGESLDLVVDHADQVQLAYTWRSGGYTDLWFGWRDAGGTWDTGYYVDGYTVSGSTHIGRYVSIAVDSGNLPSFAYFDAANKVPVLADYTSYGVAIYTDIDVYWAWTYATGYFTTLAIDSEDFDHVAWFDDNLLGSEAQYSDFNEGTVNETVAADGWYTSLALQSDDTACLAWQDSGPFDLMYGCRDAAAGTWSATKVDRTGRVGAYAQLAFTSADQPWIAYFDESNGDLKVATLDTTGWVTWTVDETGTVGIAPSIAVGPDDRVYISYYDETNGALKVAVANR